MTVRFGQSPDDAKQLAALLAAAEPPPKVQRDLTEFLWGLAREYFPLKVVMTGPAAGWTDGPLWPVPGTADDDTLVRKARRSKSDNDVMFDDLWTANADKLGRKWPANPDSKSGLPYDASSADQALINHFVWWTGGDCARVERLMQREDCGLRRAKWDERLDYRRDTILNALALVAENPPKEKTMSVPKFGGTLPASAAPTPSTPAPPAAAEAFDYKKHMGSVQDLLDNPPPPIEFIQTGLLAKGATALLIGKPKSFKTTLAYQMALAYCDNPDLLSAWAEFGEVTGAYHVAILDYEQSDQIAAQLLARFGRTKAPGLLRLNAFPKLDEAGLAELEKLIKGEKLDVVIIDSWTRAMPPLRQGAGVFMGEGEIMQRVTSLSHRLGCLIVVIAHGGKRDAADDPMQMIAGTNALPASVDDVLVLFKDKDDDDEGGTIRRKLFASGRNIARPGTYVLERRATAAAFVLKGTEESLIRGEAQQKIFGLLNGAGGPMTPTAIGKSLDIDRANVHRALQRLVADKMVVALEDGKYESCSAMLVRKFGKRETK